MPLQCEIAVEEDGRRIDARRIGPDQSLVMGRRGGCDIRLANLRVSSRHARIFGDGEAFWVEDLGSSNSTWLNGKKCEGKVRLADGDLVHVKPYCLRIALREGGPGLVQMGERTADNAFANLFGEEVNTTQEVPALLQVRDHLSREMHDISRPGLPQTESGEREREQELRRTMKALETARRANRQLQYRVRMHRRIHFSETEQGAIQGVMDLAQKALKADVAFLMFVNPRTGSWEVKCKSEDFEGFSRASAESGARSPVSFAMLRAALEDKSPKRFPDAKRPALAKDESIVANMVRAAVAAPLFENDKVVGCFYVDRRADESKPYSPEDAEDALSFAQIFVDAAVHFIGRKVLAEREAAERRTSLEDPGAPDFDDGDADDIFEDADLSDDSLFD